MLIIILSSKKNRELFHLTSEFLLIFERFENKISKRQLIFYLQRIIPLLSNFLTSLTEKQLSHLNAFQALKFKEIIEDINLLEQFHEILYTQPRFGKLELFPIKKKIKEILESLLSFIKQI